MLYLYVSRVGAPKNWFTSGNLILRRTENGVTTNQSGKHLLAFTTSRVSSNYSQEEKLPGFSDQGGSFKAPFRNMNRGCLQTHGFSHRTIATNI